MACETGPRPGLVTSGGQPLAASASACSSLRRMIHLGPARQRQPPSRSSCVILWGCLQELQPGDVLPQQARLEILGMPPAPSLQPVACCKPASHAHQGPSQHRLPGTETWLQQPQCWVRGRFLVALGTYGPRDSSEDCTGKSGANSHLSTSETQGFTELQCRTSWFHWPCTLAPSWAAPGPTLLSWPGCTSPAFLFTPGPAWLVWKQRATPC